MEEIKKLTLELNKEKKYDVKKIDTLTKLINNTKIDKPLITWLEEESNKGNTQAQYNLGYMYRYGLGVEKDYNETLKFYKLSADQGHPVTQNNLGYMYRYGFGVEKDYKEAIKWYKLSANQGHPAAQNNLGYMYDNGLGVRQDYKEALKWYKLSAEQGCADAQFAVGYIYQYGIGVIEDYKEAIKWYKLSADQGDVGAKKKLDILYKNNKDTIISILLALGERNKELEEEIDKLKYMAPIMGGPEYQKVKNDFEQKAEKMKKSGSLELDD